MMGRALSLAAATLFCCLAASPGFAQQNLDAGKSPAQIFNGNCGVCHRSAKGLLKTVSPSSLPEFLRQHYTTGGEMAQMLSGYLTSNRAAAAEPDAAAGKRGARPQGSNLRSDAPVGAGAPTGSENGADQSRSDRKPRAATAKPEEGTEPVVGKRRPRPEAAPAADAAGGAGTSPGAKSRQAKRGKRGEPPVTSPQPPADVATKPDAGSAKEVAQPKDSERSIDARVPVPEPVDLPPPTAADIKPAETRPTESKPAEVKPAEAKPEPAASTVAGEKASPERPAETPRPAASPAEAAAAPAGSPPTPPISQ